MIRGAVAAFRDFVVFLVVGNYRQPGSARAVGEILGFRPNCGGRYNRVSSTLVRSLLGCEGERRSPLSKWPAAFYRWTLNPIFTDAWNLSTLPSWTVPLRETTSNHCIFFTVLPASAMAFRVASAKLSVDSPTISMHFQTKHFHLPGTRIASAITR